jgi:hypothetical protein
MGCKRDGFLLLVDKSRKVRVVNNDYRKRVNVYFVLLITITDLFLSSFAII